MRPGGFMLSTLDIIELTATAKARIAGTARLVIADDVTAQQFAAIVEGSDKSRLLPEMDAIKSDLFRANAVFITVTDADGELAASTSVRCFDIDDEPFTEFLATLYGRLYTPKEAPFDVNRVPPVFNHLQGRLAYMGEFFIAPKYRRKIDITDLSCLSYGLTALRYKPHWYFGFMRRRHALSGLAAKYLATRTIPGALRWNRAVEHRKDDDWFVCSRRDEMMYSLREVSERYNAEKTTS